MERAPRYCAELVGYRVASSLVRWLPQQIAYRWAELLGRLAFACGGRRVGYTLTNLRIAFPELDPQERRAIGRRSFENTVRSIVDVLRADGWSREDLHRHVEIAGLEHMQGALARGRGALLLTLHLGSFELAPWAIGLAGVPLTVVGRALSNPFLESRLSAARRRGGAELIDRTNGASRMLRALRKGRVIGLLIDLYSRRARGIFVPLFGARCSTTPGLAVLALRAGAPVVPFYIVRDGPEHHRGVFLPELQFKPSGDRQQDVADLTALCNETLERVIRRYPEQWIWAHRRFRKSPDVSTPVYARRGSTLAFLRDV